LINSFYVVDDDDDNVVVEQVMLVIFHLFSMMIHDKLENEMMIKLNLMQLQKHPYSMQHDEEDDLNYCMHSMKMRNWNQIYWMN
jgi:hypothetical protein